MPTLQCEGESKGPALLKFIISLKINTYTKQLRIIKVGKQLHTILCALNCKHRRGSGHREEAAWAGTEGAGFPEESELALGFE